MEQANADGGASGSRAERFFWAITASPRLILIVGLLGIIVMATGVPGLVKDTTADAFIAKDNAAVVYRDRVRELFGLDDPFAIAVISERSNGIYAQEALALVEQLTRTVRSVENVDPDRVRSLATESNIVGTADGMDVTQFYELGKSPDGDAIRAAIEDFPLYQGTLVSEDGSGTLIIAEVIDTDRAQETYDELLALVEGINTPPGLTIHIAGEAAVAGYLGTYIDRDAVRLNPLSALTITLVLVLAFRTAAGALLPNLIVAATATGALGLMAYAGVPFYVITNGLLPILIGIAVADSIHILSEYYELAGAYPDASRRQHIVCAMVRMWRPVTLTTLTTIAGFMGLWLGAKMPPMQYFGLYAAIGVFIAWIYSLLFLPAAVTLVPIKPSPLFRRRQRDKDVIAQAMIRFGRFVLSHPRPVVASIALIIVLGIGGASQLVVEESQIENFQHDEAIYLADQAINTRFDGVNYLDVVIESPDREGLFEPEVLRRIEALQRFGETLPGVQGSTSVVDYIKQMHRSVMENDRAAYAVPEDPFLIAQLFLLYSTTGDPTDFEEEVDYDYQRANVRFNLNNSLFTNNRQVIEKMQAYIDEAFTDGQISARLTGRVFVNHHWLKTIGDNHFRSLAISLLLVWLMAALVFRSLLAGAFALIPVLLSILIIYAVMGFGGIWLGVGTSMFAAIAIGLGIDFAIHTLDRMRELARRGKGALVERLLPLFPGTGRALFFNFAAIGLGFALLTTSEVPPLVKFGLLVAVAVTAAFIGSMALMPALAVMLRPRFIVGDDAQAKPDARPARALTGVGLSVSILFAVCMSVDRPALADELAQGRAIMQAVADRDEGEWVTRKLKMTMTDRNGTERVRETMGYRRYFGEEKRTVLFYTAPSNVKGTGFLTWDYPEADRDDDQWLYLPALRKVRRISASDRGDYFLGTDFTYEDIKKENKIAMEDYKLRHVADESLDGIPVRVVEGVPVDEETAEELGYGRARWYVDPQINISRKTESWDTAGNPLKTTLASDIVEIDGIITVRRIAVHNHKTGHATVFEFSDIDYQSEVDERVFRTAALKRGAR